MATRTDDILNTKIDPSPFVEGGHLVHDVGIHFNLDDSRVTLEKIQDIERLFHEMGITFDTGAGSGERDWFFDWSLKGPIKVSIQERKNDAYEEMKRVFRK